jgi:hypothetical protein
MSNGYDIIVIGGGSGHKIVGLCTHSKERMP